MKCLIVTTHPLSDSLCMFFTDKVTQSLKMAGHEVVVEDLYRDKFDPVLTEQERQSYYAPQYDCSEVEIQINNLLEAEAVVLLFPTWWFGFPALLKGWFDRVWAPGAAYDHSDGFGPIRPRLHRLRRVLAVTTLGAPWWVDFLVMGRPIRKIIKIALLSTCAPNCSFEMLSLYKSEKLTTDKVDRFTNRIMKTLDGWR